MKRFIAKATAVMRSVVSANARYKMRVMQNDGGVSKFLVSKIKEVIWEKLVEPINPEPEQGTHEYVDLGLPSGTKWATSNVGASSPEDYGDYYAWGETETKDYYDWSTYKWCKGGCATMTKYCTDSRYGTVDNKTVLDPEDDVAHVKWGGSWRMPTNAEMTELREKCVWTWTSQNGTRGYKVTSKSNGKSFFLPAAGVRWNDGLDDAGSYGYYWSGTLYDSNDHNAYVLYFGGGRLGWDYYDRSNGQAVRPVCP